MFNDGRVAEETMVSILRKKLSRILYIGLK